MGAGKTSTSKVLIPVANGIDNQFMSDVLGNRDDKSFSNRSFVVSGVGASAMGHLKAGYYHVHSPAKVYPPLADAITLTANASGWTYGTKVEIIPASTITVNFDIHWIIVSEISAVDEYELSLYSGEVASEVLIATVAFNRSSTFAQEGNLPCQIPPQLANKRISAALACKSTNARTCTIKLYYHEYPDVTVE